LSIERNPFTAIVIFVQLACLTNYVCWTGTQISGSGSNN